MASSSVSLGIHQSKWFRPSTSARLRRTCIALGERLARALDDQRHGIGIDRNRRGGTRGGKVGRRRHRRRPERPDHVVAHGVGHAAIEFANHRHLALHRIGAFLEGDPARRGVVDAARGKGEDAADVDRERLRAFGLARSFRAPVAGSRARTAPCPASKMRGTATAGGGGGAEAGGAVVAADPEGRDRGAAPALPVLALQAPALPARGRGGPHGCGHADLPVEGKPGAAQRDHRRDRDRARNGNRTMVPLARRGRRRRGGGGRSGFGREPVGMDGARDVLDVLLAHVDGAQGELADDLLVDRGRHADAAGRRDHSSRTATLTASPIRSSPLSTTSPRLMPMRSTSWSSGAGRRVGRAHRLLDLERGPHRLDRAREFGQQSVAGQLEDTAAMMLHDRFGRRHAGAQKSERMLLVARGHGAEADDVDGDDRGQASDESWVVIARARAAG